MADKRPTRRRNQDPSPPEEREAPTSPRAFRAERRVEPTRQDASLDLSELEALASMGADELAKLMEGGPTRRRIRVGERVQGVLTRRGRERSLVDIAAKSEAWILTAEIGEAAIGDPVEAYIVDMEDGEIQLSTRVSGAAADEILADAKANRTPVEGTVSGRNPGGYDVKLGAVRAFCPASMMDRLPAADPDQYIGQTLQFLVIEAGEDVVVSRRALQEDQAKAGYDAFWASAAIGDEREGVVVSVQPFGVFVDIGGVQGLVHKSELGWGEVDPATAVKKGDKLKVRITGLRPEEGKLDLSAKDPANSPWRRVVGSTFREGGVYEGPVARIETYGAFVELAPGLTGLLHVSRMGAHRPKVGETVKVRVDKLDHERQRIELADADLAAAPASGTGVGATVEGIVRDVLGNGVLVDLADGRTGWLPTRNADLPAGTVLAQRFRRGRELSARVAEEAPDGRRVTLTQLEVASESWRAGESGQAGGFGTLGDLLKGWGKR